MRRFLIVGKNSKIVKELRESQDLSEFDFISFVDVQTVDFSRYLEIFVFSWDHRSISGNVSLISKMPLHKVVFVSSMAVRALDVRPQWARYPNDKKEVEKLVLGGGGTILRLGFVCRAETLRVHGLVPITTVDDIGAFIADRVEQTFEDGTVVTPKVVELFSLKHVSNINDTLRSVIRFDQGNYLIAKTRLIRVAIFILLRLLKVDQRSYSADLILQFQRHIQVGFGVLGAAKHRVSKTPDSVLLLYSDQPDEILDSRGFSSTRSGKLRTGLAKFWHGAYVIERDGEYFKKVPIFVRRPSLPGGSVSATVEKLTRDNGYWIIHATNKYGESTKFCCEKLTLAAGSLTNIRLLGDFLQHSATASDHYLLPAGVITKADFLDSFQPRTIGGLVCNRKVLRGVIESEEGGFSSLCIEARPVLRQTVSRDVDFYNKQTYGIVMKLITQFSLSRVNEAFYNKFGWGICSNNWELVVQLLDKDSIKYTPASGFEKRHLNRAILASIDALLTSKFPSFTAFTSRYAADGQHVLGGEGLISHPTIVSLLQDNILEIVGSPSKKSLGAFHHTESLRREIIEEHSEKIVMD